MQLIGLCLAICDIFLFRMRMEFELEHTQENRRRRTWKCKRRSMKTSNKASRFRVSHVGFHRAVKKNSRRLSCWRGSYVIVSTVAVVFIFLFFSPSNDAFCSKTWHSSRFSSLSIVRSERVMLVSTFPRNDWLKSSKRAHLFSGLLDPFSFGSFQFCCESSVKFAKHLSPRKRDWWKNLNSGKTTNEGLFLKNKVTIANLENLLFSNRV